MRSTVTVMISDDDIVAVLKADQAQDKLDAAANAALQIQRSLVPIDTGVLLGSLGIKKIADGLGRKIGSFGVHYAEHVEYGHEVRDTGVMVPAQPYIRPSIDAVRRVFK